MVVFAAIGAAGAVIAFDPGYPVLVVIAATGVVVFLVRSFKRREWPFAAAQRSAL